MLKIYILAISKALICKVYIIIITKSIIEGSKDNLPGVCWGE